MKRIALIALLLPVLLACERRQESASTTPSAPTATPPSAATAPAPAAPQASNSEAAKAATAPSPDASAASSTGATSGASSGATSSASSGSSGEYTVAAGDTLSGIAREHGVRSDELAKWNNIKDPNRIHPGQTLKLSGSDS